MRVRHATVNIKQEESKTRISLWLSTVFTHRSPWPIVPTFRSCIQLNYCHFLISQSGRHGVLRKTALLLLLEILVHQAWAQTTGAVPPPVAGALVATAAGAEDSIPTIRKSVEEVNLIFTATDKRGRFKKNLK